MVVRELFWGLDDARVIARAIFEDHAKNEKVDGWIQAYFALLSKLKNRKIRKSSMMFYLSVVCDENRQYADVSGFEYVDIKAGRERYFTIENLNARQYASLYVPEYTVQTYGQEVVAAEALREYGWNGYDESIICPEVVRRRVLEILETMETGIFPPDKDYFTCCRKQFKLFYEGG